MKKYELKYTEGDEGVFRMSTVESPATKTHLVMFDDEIKLLEFQDDEKQVIYSVAMRPNMLIPRKDINGEPAMVFYTEETVQSLQQNFFKTGANLGATINHDGVVREDMYIFESWMVLNPECDKSKSMNMSTQKGDLVLGQKVENKNVWQKIKNKELTGFSIEAFLEPVLINNEIQMTEQEVDARIKKVLMESSLGKEYAVGEKKYFIDKIEVGGVVTDDQGLPMPNQEIEVDGSKLKTDDKGVITEVETEMAGEPAQSEPAPDAGNDLQKKVDELTAENNELKAQLTKLESAKVEMSAELVATKKVAVEMGEQIKKGIPVNPEKNVGEMTALEKYRSIKNN